MVSFKPINSYVNICGTDNYSRKGEKYEMSEAVRKKEQPFLEAFGKRGEEMK